MQNYLFGSTGFVLTPHVRVVPRRFYTPLEASVFVSFNVFHQNFSPVFGGGTWARGGVATGRIADGACSFV